MTCLESAELIQVLVNEQHWSHPGVWRRTTVVTPTGRRLPGASHLCRRWGRRSVCRSNAVQMTSRPRVRINETERRRAIVATCFSLSCYKNVWILTLSATIIRGVVLVIFKVKGGLMMWDQVACSKTQAIKNPIFALCNYGKKKSFWTPWIQKNKYDQDIFVGKSLQTDTRKCKWFFWFRKNGKSQFLSLPWMCGEENYPAEASSLDLDGSVPVQKGACGLWVPLLKEIPDLRLIHKAICHSCMGYPKTFFIVM